MITQVDFHTGVADCVLFACRLLRKAHRQQASLAVRAPAPTLVALDRALWVFDPQEFLPHLLLRGAGGHDALALRRTPIWLLDGPVPDPGPPILINIDAEPDGADPGFERVIEIVGTAPEGVRAARARWRQYERRGWSIRHHPAAAAAPG